MKRELIFLNLISIHLFKFKKYALIIKGNFSDSFLDINSINGC